MDVYSYTQDLCVVGGFHLISYVSLFKKPLQILQWTEPGPPCGMWPVTGKPAGRTASSATSPSVRRCVQAVKCREFKVIYGDLMVI